VVTSLKLEKIVPSFPLFSQQWLPSFPKTFEFFLNFLSPGSPRELQFPF